MQPSKKFKYDPLEPFRITSADLIKKRYKTVEEFCWEKNIPKSVLSRLLSGKQTEFHLETLTRIAKALGKKVVIRLE
jgi:predicted transcriptional regulator